MKRRLTTAPADGATVKIDTNSVPAYSATNLAQCLFRAIHADMDNPEIQADFLRWKNDRRKRYGEQHTSAI